MPYESIESIDLIQLIVKLQLNVDKLVCSACFTKLTQDDLQGLDYPHEGGICIKGAGKLWLYFHCNKCCYDTALWKLRIEGLQ